MVNVVGLDETDIDSVPDVPLPPVHAPPDAMQLVALVDDHVSVVFCGRDCPEERMI